MKEFYPYTIVPQKVDKIRQEGIPAPKLPKLLVIPVKARRKYLGTIIFVISLFAFIAFNVIPKKSYPMYMYLSFFIALISLVATIFEFVQYGKLKKQYIQDLKHYHEHKEAYKSLKAKQEQIEKENKDQKLVKEYQQNKIKEFFKTSYNVINAIHNEYSPAKKRFKLFLEEYFPDEILDNIKVTHETKKLDYIPDFIIQFEKPELNVAIEIEEPYSLSNIPENIQKDYDAKDRVRQRFANELGWIIIVLSEEQAVVSPTECCKFIEESIELLFGDIKNDNLFVNIKSIKKQKMLSGEERASLKKSKYREKYLIEAGLMDGPIGYPREKKSLDITENEDTQLPVNEVNGNGKVEEDITKSKLINEKVESELNKAMDEKKTPPEKKKEIENEQMQLIKKIAQKVKTVSDVKNEKKEPIKYKTDDGAELIKDDKKLEKQSTTIAENGKDTNVEKSLSNKGKQLRREEDILKDLYQALDKHSRKQQERKETSEIDEEDTNKLAEKELIKTKETEKKVKTAAEIILEKKEKLEQLAESKVKEKTSKEEISNAESSTITEKKGIEEKTVINSSDEKEVVLEEKTVAEKKNEISEEALKNQEIIDAYRERIEGAVFDKQWDELMDLCNEAIKEIPYWDWAYYRRSTAWGNRREFTNVVLDCNKAIGFNPTLADAYYNRGTAHFFLGKYMEASDDYQKSIDLNYVKKADAYFNRGLCFQKLDHQKKAHREFLKAKEMGSQKAAEIIKNQYLD